MGKIRLQLPTPIFHSLGCKCSKIAVTHQISALQGHIDFIKDTFISKMALLYTARFYEISIIVIQAYLSIYQVAHIKYYAQGYHHISIS